jgi:hypothetical protein
MMQSVPVPQVNPEHAMIPESVLLAAAALQPRDLAVESHPESPRVLISFRHGLGDVIQLTSVLNHLRHYHPNWVIDVEVTAGPTRGSSCD